MLGTLDEADDAVQEAWLRLSRTDASAVENLGAWLTTVGRVSLDMLLAGAHAARSRRLMATQLIVTIDGDPTPEEEALIGDAVGLALMVVLVDAHPGRAACLRSAPCSPCCSRRSRLSLGASPAAARQLASRARAEVQGAPVPDADLSRQWEVVDAFVAASREGDFEALLAVLNPDVVLRVDRAVPPGAATQVRGARAVAARALTFSPLAEFGHPALVNGAAGGLVVTPDGQLISVMGFTVKDSNREDRRDRHPCRPSAPRSARSGDSSIRRREGHDESSSRAQTGTSVSGSRRV